MVVDLGPEKVNVEITAGVGVMNPPLSYPHAKPRTRMSNPKAARLHQNWGNLGTSSEVRVIRMDTETGEIISDEMHNARSFGKGGRTRKSAPKVTTARIAETATVQSRYRHDFNA